MAIIWRDAMSKANLLYMEFDLFVRHVQTLGDITNELNMNEWKGVEVSLMKDGEEKQKG